MGEEKYLLAHAFISNNNKQTENKRQSAGAHIFRVIGAKYPNRIRDLYHAKLKMPWSQTPPDSDHIEQIVGCKLSRAEKISLFEEGLRQKEIGHRIQALEGLDQLDKALFNKRLLQLLEESTASIKKRDIRTAIAFSLASIVRRSDDQLCWNAYLAAAKASPYEGRLYFIQVMNCEVGETDDPDPSRRQRLMFFVAFLDDRTTVLDDPNAKPDEVHCDFEVRDYAASMLSYIYEFPVTGPPYYSYSHDHQRGPLTAPPHA